MKVRINMATNNSKKSLTILAGLSIATIHLINRFEYTTACSNIPLRTREDREYEWRFGKIKYKKIGHGSPIILLHDLTIGSSKAEFEYIQKSLSKNHTLYIPDILGYGESDKPAMTYTASIIEEFISDFIKVVIGNKTDTIAVGSTAPIVLKLANDNSKLLGNIVMINPLGLYDQNLIPSNETKLLKLAMELPIIGTYIYNIHSTRTNIDKTFHEEYIARPALMDSKKLACMIDEYYRCAHIGGFKAKYSHASFMSQYMTCNILHELKEINHSILIIGGSEEKDIETNIENYKYYNNAIESILIKGTSHLPHIEKPKEIVEQIEVFIS